MRTGPAPGNAGGGPGGDRSARTLNGPLRPDLPLLGGGMTPLMTLDALAERPDLARELSPETVRALTLRAAAVLAALGTATLDGSVPRLELPTEDRLLTAEEAAARLGTTPRWLRRRAGKLPFARRLSRKTVRYSEAGLTRWLAARRAPG